MPDTSTSEAPILAVNDETKRQTPQGLDKWALPTDQRDWDEGLIDLRSSATYENQPEMKEYLRLLGSDSANDRADQINEGRKKLINAMANGIGFFVQYTSSTPSSDLSSEPYRGHFWAKLLGDKSVRTKIGRDVLRQPGDEWSNEYRCDSVLTSLLDGLGWSLDRSPDRSATGNVTGLSHGLSMTNIRSPLPTMIDPAPAPTTPTYSMVIAHMYSWDCNPVYVALETTWFKDIPMIYDEIDRALVKDGIAVSSRHWYESAEVP
ncbi:hypothetical protein IAR50_003608 [Cryptococcus sp. DSM 104548]